MRTLPQLPKEMSKSLQGSNSLKAKHQILIIVWTKRFPEMRVHLMDVVRSSDLDNDLSRHESTDYDIIPLNGY